MRTRLAIASLAIFIAIAVGVINGSFIAIDNSISSAFSSMQNTFLDYTFSFFSFLFNTSTAIVLSLALVGYLHFTKRKKDALNYAIILAGGAILGQALKFLFAVQRPESVIDHLGYSFPSGHTIKATLLMIVLVLAFKEKIANTMARNAFIAISAITIILTGLSRIYLGAHWASDVAGGFFFATGWIALMTSRNAQ